MRILSSAQNPTVKRLQSLLQKSRTRKQEQCFVVEGLREITAALAAGAIAESIFIDAAFAEHLEVITVVSRCQNATPFLLTTPIFAKCAYRSGVPNALAIFPMHPLQLSDLTLPEKPLLLILDQIEKPGNLGAMLRTADAAGVDAVIITDPLTDIYNPNVIRNSLGSFFTNAIAVATQAECINWLKDKGITIYVTYLEAAKPYWEVDLKQAAAIVLGTEAVGVNNNWIQAAAQNIIIPMNGKMDSLNVSNAAAIVLFEAVRQRQLVTK
ncbi:MAG: RNA methyltransferase [Schleiferiaceae bacterium]|nr:RNA methyltransferase [Schleiferiaceae bacterium]